jgi:hypothetical protein
MKTSFVLEARHQAEDVFPRDLYERPMIVDLLVREDDRAERLHARLDRCGARLEALARRLDRIEQFTRQYYDPYGCFD